MNKYIGNESQLYGVELHRLVGGRGDGMRLLEVRNGKGLEITVSADRCADISRLIYKGNNLGYFAPCGYVAPSYYDKCEAGFLKSFTAGFMTTCGLRAVGSPCTDDGERLPLHGEIANTPAETLNYGVESDSIYIEAVMRDAALFADKLLLKRRYTFSLKENKFEIKDTVKNIGSNVSPYMILYHINIGYPLLDEDTVFKMPGEKMRPRDDEAAKYIDNSTLPEKPQKNFVERCYLYSFDKKEKVTASAYNKKINTKLEIEFDTSELDMFTQWKQMGEQEYVMGLEPGNCTPEGRDVMREKGMLKFIEPGQEITQSVIIKIS